MIVARYNSKRLSGKATLKVAGKTLLEHLFLRVKKAKLIDKIIFCTTKKIRRRIGKSSKKQNKSF